MADHFGHLLDRCPDKRWDAPSPCEGWTARDVAAHVVRNHRRALAGLDGSESTVPSAEEDVRAAWREATDGVRAALANPERADQPMGPKFQNTTFTGFVHRRAFADTLVHSWDLARATGQDETRATCPQ